MMRTAVAADEPAVTNPTVAVRTDDGKEHECSVRNATDQLLRSAQPWRTFRWYFGQRHYSGNYWTATTQQPLIYESLLEKANLLLADFDRDITHIVSQPFLMRATVNGTVRRHVPDFLFFRRDSVSVVNVKPSTQLDNPKVVDTFAWVRRVVEDRGWSFEIATEPDRIRLANVRYLRGFCKPTGISTEILHDLRTRALIGRTLAESVALIDAPAPCVRAALFHMLWHHDLSIDLTRMLSSDTVLEVTK
ncbi:TnsA endonuclease N terminal protein [Mycolicibacterium fortuitum]|jgi:hypothetical protein|uniref:TnsA endonuclease N terminal protein n=1 Tax=Mycolicibacterium fortuitum TaxID=1766 RepID=A0A378WC09_MYCFO|nr:TnsA endonuclease N terminal protein [Mycolicibacterium fortuitum]